MVQIVHGSYVCFLGSGSNFTVFEKSISSFVERTCVCARARTRVFMLFGFCELFALSSKR